MTDENVAEQVAKWALTGKTGVSSKAIAQHLCGLPCDGGYPHDAGDFERCEGLLNAVPSFRARIGEMATVNRYWAALAPRWEEVRTAPHRRKALDAILRPVEDKDRNFVRLGDGVSFRVGRPA